jgi:DNA-directed RNA polymerase specialized sigma subunit
MDDMKGLRTLIDDGMSQPEMAAYYGVSQSTISRLIKELMDDEDGKCKR